ncbi:MAG TPA: hypothetical protein VHR45_01635 [Thermoanaerobaculia bacterium]|nr:hypothetical protein [Thermoanaerobaculia bacterium]
MSLLTSEARAQNVSSDILRDSQIARADAAASTDRHSVVSRNAFVDQAATEESKLGFTFNFFGPLLFNSNAEAARAGGTSTIEGNPEVRLGWSKKLSNWLTLSALWDASIDRFVRSNDADSDTAYARMRLQYTSDPDDDQSYAPFFSYYSPNLEFKPTFSRRTATFHSVLLGFDKVFNYGSDWKRVARVPDSSRGTVWSFGFTGSIARRYVDSRPSLYIVTAVPSLTYTPPVTPTFNLADAHWNVSFEVDTRYRIYDQHGGQSRRDWFLEPILTIEFLPPFAWFGGKIKQLQEKRVVSHGRPTVDFQVALTQLDSNEPGARYRQWAIGPTIKLTWSF